MDFFGGLEKIVDSTIGQIPVVGGVFSDVVDTGLNIAETPNRMFEGLFNGFLGGGGGGGNTRSAGGSPYMGATSTGDTSTILMVGGAGLLVLYLLVRR